MSDVKFIPLYIGGQERRANNDATFEVRNPANGEVVAKAAAATAEDW